MSFRYRHIVEDDVAAIARVHRDACLIAYKFMNWAYGEDETRDWVAGKYREWDWGLVAEDRRTVVGFAVTIGTHLDLLFVEPDHQGVGIGTSLLAAALKKVPSVVTLTVFEENAPARRFYERHGFRQVRRFMNLEEAAIELEYRRESGNSS
jgi:putative acetyltransferase